MGKLLFELCASRYLLLASSLGPPSAQGCLSPMCGSLGVSPVTSRSSLRWKAPQISRASAQPVSPLAWWTPMMLLREGPPAEGN